MAAILYRLAQTGFGDRGQCILDWFRIAMWVQNLEQIIKALRGAKWHLWHGCPYPALRRLESLGWDLDAEASPEEAKLLAKLEGFLVPG